MKKLLKEHEYPKYIACLAQGCPSCILLAKGTKYTDCKCFNWKNENRNKYDLEVIDGKITRVWAL